VAVDWRPHPAPVAPSAQTASAVVNSLPLRTRSSMTLEGREGRRLTRPDRGAEADAPARRAECGTPEQPQSSS
jgi:hypothetical protein